MKRKCAVNEYIDENGIKIATEINGQSTRN